MPVPNEWSEGVCTLRFYKEIERALKTFHAMFSDEYLAKVKRRRLYWDALELLTPVPMYRANLRDTSSSVFKRLSFYPVQTGTKDFFFKFHTEVLPVKTWLDKKGFFVPWSKNCALCPYEEDLRHVFFDCTNAQLFWAQLRQTLQVQLYPEWESCKFLEFGNGTNRSCLETLALLGLHAIWRSRTDHLLVAVGGKPAWRHFVDGFQYVSSVLSAREWAGYDDWKAFQKRLSWPSF